MPATKNDNIYLGIPGTDIILPQGLIPGCTYLIRGGPGSGKTTLGMHFLTADSTGTGMFITFGESAAQLNRNAQTLGFCTEKMSFIELLPSMDDPGQEESYTIFSADQVEGKSLINDILEAFEEHKPKRIFIDSLTQLRYLAPDSFQFRKQILSLFRELTQKGATLLCTSEVGAEAKDDDLQFLSDGIIQLGKNKQGRTFSISKLRGTEFQEGEHDMCLGKKGMQVFPHLIPSKHQSNFSAETISSGVPELDKLLHGGLERGTVTIVSGPSGVGKTTLGIQFMKEAAGRGEKSVVMAFEEDPATMIYRSESINIPVREMLEQDTLKVEAVEPLHYTPDQFAAMVRYEVETNKVSLLMLDGLSGYRQSVQGTELTHHLHALCRYLRNMGVTVLIINEQESVAGTEFRTTENGISYLADSIILLQYLEVYSELRKIIGVLKKRTGDFEKILREYAITPFGIKVGQPLKGLHGILRGIPELSEENELQDSGESTSKT